MARKLGIVLSVADQGVRSLVSFVLVFLVAIVSSGPGEYGVVALCLTSGLVLAGIVLSFLVEPYASGVQGDKFSTSSLVLNTWLSMLVGCAMILVVSILIGMIMGDIYVGLLSGFAVASMALIDYFRVSFLASKKINYTFTLSAVWFLTLGTSLFFVHQFWLLSVNSVLIIVSLASWSIYFCILIIFVFCSKNNIKSKKHEFAAESSQFAKEYALTRTPVHIVLLIVGLVGGASDAGILRLIQTMYSPFNTVLVGLRQGLVPLYRRSSVSVMRWVPLLLFVLGLFYLVFLWLGKEYIYGILNWDVLPKNRDLLLFGINQMFVGATIGCVIMLRISNQKSSSFRPRLLSALAILACGGSGAVLGGGEGAIVGLLLGSIVSFVLFFVCCFRLENLHLNTKLYTD